MRLLHRKESLNVSEDDFDEDVTIPEYFEVTADVENFSLDMTMTVVMNATNFISAEGGEDASSLEEQLDTPADVTSQLEEDSAKLADGVSSLQSGAGTLADGAATLSTSVQAISNGIAALDNTLRTPLTDEERAAYSAQAVALVDASFASGTDTTAASVVGACQSASQQAAATAL